MCVSMMWLVQQHGEARIKQWWCDQVLAMMELDEDAKLNHGAQDKGIM
jgi:hypothetical protein